MKKIFLFMFVCLMASTPRAQDTEISPVTTDFQDPSGTGIWYTVLDESAHTCQTKAGYYDTSTMPYKVTPGNTATGSVVIPSQVTYQGQAYTVVGIGDFGFGGTFTSLILPQSLLTIGQGAFIFCTGLTEISIPPSVSAIGASAFADCTSLASVSLPEGLTRIEDSTFANCSNLKSINFPASLGSIGKNAFAESGITSAPIANVTSLGEYAFNTCKSLSSVEFSENLTAIPASAFAYCYALTEITLPANVSQIGAFAFQGCNSLVKITSLSAVPPAIGNRSFSTSANSNATLYVPLTGLQAYKQNSLWKSFANIQAIPVDATGITLDKQYLTIYALGPSVQLHATVTPADATQPVNWSVSPENLATVTNGLVHGLNAGVATVTATCGSYSATCEVTILNIAPSYVVVNLPGQEIYPGDQVALTATIHGASQSIPVTWTSSNDQVATINPTTGLLTAVSPGAVIISATANGVTGSRTVTVNEVLAESITLSSTSETLKVGGSCVLTATVNPSNTTNQTVTWSSNDDNVAIVTDGTVIATGVGIATITAACGNTTATCTVTVEPTPVSSITLNTTAVTLQISQSQQLTATVAPENATDKTVLWTSDNTAVATVSSEGLITAVAAGSATITATSGNVSAQCSVTVEEPEPEAIVIDMTQVVLKATQTQQLTANLPVTWSSDNNPVATVSSTGLVTAVSVGTATITATNGKTSATCIVTVEPTPAESVTLNATDITINVSGSYTLTASVMPQTTTDKTIVWNSANADIATVSNGKVTGVAPGSTLITAECGGIKATCKVTVLQPAQSVTLNQSTLTLITGDIADLIATVNPENTTDVLTWTSLNTAAVSVNQYGIVRALSPGTSTITAQCGSAKATCLVTVKPIQAESITLDKTELTLKVSQSQQLSATVLPEKATGYTVSWTSSNQNVATVSPEGIVTAVSAGTAVIRATCDEVYAECNVTVEAVEEGNIVIDYPEITLKATQTQQLGVTIPDSLKDQNVTWTSSNEAVATVSNTGLVTAISVGSATITATCGSAQATCSVTVEETPVEKIVLNTYDVNLYIGETTEVVATVLPETATDKTVTWASSNEAVATVSPEGVITAVSAGTTSITASAGSVSIPCLVTVLAVQAQEVILDSSEVSVNVGANVRITATVLPENATDKTITWIAGDPEVATVTDGVITGVAPGKTIVTALCGEAVATCEVTVLQPVQSIELNISELTLKVGEVETLIATVTPENTTDAVVWESTSPNIAEVNQEGVVAALATGETTIVASCGSFYATCQVTVIKGSTTGIGNILPDNDGFYHVFDLNGLNILNTREVSDILTLQGGIYVINGKKYVISE